MAIRLLFKVSRLSTILQSYDKIAVFWSATEDGDYEELTTTETRITLTRDRETYEYIDAGGDLTRWYRSAYYNTTNDTFSEQTAPMQGVDQDSTKVGYTFGNYTPPPGEWGEALTPDDMRFTWLFGIDTTAANIARDEWEDEQYRQIIRESIAEFESYLTMDIMRKKYVTDPSDSLIQSRYWNAEVDYTNIEEPYEFDPNYWGEFGFLQLRHRPLLSVQRCIWMTPVKSPILDMVENNWLRIYREFGQLRMFPRTGFPYGPFAVYGNLWRNTFNHKYPGGFEVDYETGYKSSDFIPENLRAIIGKYGAIKALAAIGDGLLAGFSSQSISLDGLSESFSSTQSATSAYFGARIAQYAKEIKEWLQRNRNKFSPIPMSFTG